jgi:DNA mismatch endonuclease (patch repair protein)
MSRQATRDTGPEIALRRELHRRGLRYRVHFRPLPALRRTADIVFTRRGVAVFVDGCFWHSCPEHRTFPVTNQAFWAAKLARNVERDRETDRLLAAAGWTVIRMWEHEDPAEAADRLEAVVRATTVKK